MDEQPLMVAAGSFGEPVIGADSEVPVRQTGQWGMVWRRFRQHRMAVLGGWVALAMILLALLGPLVSPGFVKVDPTTGNLPLWAYQRANHPPQLSWPFLMGTDGLGSPVVSTVLEGGRPLLAIGIFGALLTSLLGMAFGGVAGYLGGIVDALLMRLVDALLAIPFLLLLVLLSQYLPQRTLLSFILLFGLVGWPGIARLVRGYVLSLREREYAEAARALGVSPWGIIARHLLPNALDVIVVSFTLNVAVYVITAVTLGFLGVDLGAVTWNMPASPLGGYWWQIVFPGAALLLTVLSVNFLGDGLRDALDTTSPTAVPEVKPQREPGPIGRGARAVAGRVGQGTALLAGLVAIVGQGVSQRAVAALAGSRPNGAAKQPGQREGRAATRGRPYRAIVGTAVSAHPFRGTAALRQGPVGRLVRAERAREYHPAPLLMRFGPIVLVLLALGIVFLYGHSPLVYSPHYAAPVALTPTYGEAPYTAWPRRRGGWDVFAVDEQSRVSYQRFDSRGRPVLRQELGAGDDMSQPSMAKSGGRTLGAWVVDEGQVVEVAFLGKQRSPVHRLIPPGGIAEHPDVVATPQGFEVLFDWQRPGTNPFDLYLASVPLRGRPHLVRLVHTRDYALYPRGIVDGSGALDVLYLQRTDADHGVWTLFLRRFTPAGPPIGRRRSLGTVSYVAKRKDGSYDTTLVPSQWGVDLKRAKDGSVWAAFETGNDIVTQGGIEGSNVLSVMHVSRSGKLLLPPTVVDPAVDAASRAVALALSGSGGHLYYPQPGIVQPYIADVAFDARGRASAPERVNYDGGGDPANPEARAVAGRPQLIWEKVRAQSASFVTTSYHPYAPPDLLTRLGLNIGSLWGNLALVVFGSLAAGIGLTLVNVFLLLPLVLVWVVVLRRLPTSLCWPLYLLAIGLLLTLVFALPSSLPGYVLVLGGLLPAPLGSLYTWLAVAGGVFVSGWAGHYLWGKQESVLRATSMALVALYVVTTLYALLFIQTQITRI